MSHRVGGTPRQDTDTSNKRSSSPFHSPRMHLVQAGGEERRKTQPWDTAPALSLLTACLSLGVLEDVGQNTPKQSCPGELLDPAVVSSCLRSCLSLLPIRWRWRKPSVSCKEMVTLPEHPQTLRALSCLSMARGSCPMDWPSGRVPAEMLPPNPPQIPLLLLSRPASHRAEGQHLPSCHIPCPEAGKQQSPVENCSSRAAFIPDQAVPCHLRVLSCLLPGEGTTCFPHFWGSKAEEQRAEPPWAQSVCIQPHPRGGWILLGTAQPRTPQLPQDPIPRPIPTSPGC